MWENNVIKGNTEECIDIIPFAYLTKVLKIAAKNIFLVSGGKTQIEPLCFPYQCHNISKIPYWTPLEKIFLTPMALGLGLRFRVCFTFNVYCVSTKPTALSSCVTVTLQVAVE